MTSKTVRSARAALAAGAFAAVLLGAAPLAASPDPAFDASLFAGVAARSIGPAGMSGRVAAIDAVHADPDVVWVGAATGGVWKSTNGGLTWDPVFDDQPVQAVGAVAIFQRSPDIVWVGTGEGNPRNSVSVGNGVYRTADGGITWEHVGLETTERIARIVTHPTDPDTVWVAALGRSWGENPERGVYKTIDGGATWRPVLQVDARTGAADLALDPSNPKKLIAAMWDYRREPWFFRSGGPGSGLHVSLDGGETWTRRTPEDGLPEGDLGRIGVAFAPSRPSTVYALVEAKTNAMYVSHDGGATWSKAGEHRNQGNRPFYYADIRVDPARPETVYSLWSLVSVSRDGGRTFEVIVPFAEVHPDHHALWIDPARPENLILGNDGGVAFSRDRGETWDFVANLPLAQYYHIAVDMDVPYNVYGGMQDNGSWRGPGRVRENGGIRNHHWEEVGFGDGFDTRPHPEDSEVGYAMSQEGFLQRWNLRTGERKMIRPAGPGDVELRFHWNAGLAQDPFDPDTIWFGSQFVHRSTDRGDTWEIVSPDLTTNRPEWQRQAESGGLTPDVTGAENFTSILTIAPSPVERGTVWVGTDDGRLQLTRDGGETWTALEERVKGVPAHTWIPHVEASPHDAGTAFVVFDDHRRSNWTPYVFRTDDHGRTWTNLVTPELRGYALSIVQDPVDPDLLFLGTEFGLWWSPDGGARWLAWRHGVPAVGVRDLVVHPRDGDLIVGTHGRAALVLDDIRPLRGFDAAIAAKPLHAFATAPAEQYRVKQTGASRFPGHEEFRGANRPYGALLHVWISDPELPHPDEERERARKAAARAAEPKPADADAENGDENGDEDGEEDEEREEKIAVRILDATGEPVRHFRHPAHQGLNRIVWDLRRDGARRTPPSRTGGGDDDDEDDGDDPPAGPEVVPGRYTAELRLGERTVTTAVEVRADPRFPADPAGRAAKERALDAVDALQERLAVAVRRVLDARADVETLRAKAGRREEDWRRAHPLADDEDSPWHAFRERGKKLTKALDEAESAFRIPEREKGIVEDRTPSARLGRARWMLGSSWDAPTQAQTEYLERARRSLEQAEARLAELFAGEVADFAAAAEERGLGLLTAPPAATLNEEAAGPASR